MTDRARAVVTITGTVQGVGFRPFVYRTATDTGVSGFVRNAGGVVTAAFEGDRSAITQTIDRIRTDNPPLANVETVTVDWEPPTGTTTFTIESSATDGTSQGTTPVPPDTGLCDQCQAEIADPDSRYHDYWATACVDCGPRYTVIRDVPYDRSQTSMAPFELCTDCTTAYESPADRRYHAQTIACPDCGPTLTFGIPHPVQSPDEQSATERPAVDPMPDAVEETATGRAAIDRAADRIANGDIIAIKGIGGAHLACDSTNAAVVERLRRQLDRPTKPFAVMAPDLTAVEELATVSPTERNALTSLRRPIVLLAERDHSPCVSEVAPGLATIGVMLPYAGLHHLLFDTLDRPIVLTSANRPGQPMHITNAAIVRNLQSIADGVLLHPRQIVARCDDSVVRIIDDTRALLRRSRGFTPTPVDVPATGRVLAVGAGRAVTPAVLAGTDCYLAQYVGTVETVATVDALTAAIKQILRLTEMDRPATIAHDAHPGFETTTIAQRWADTQDGRAIPVQHHHAHAAGLLAEHNRDRGIVITIDGIGYGPDGTVWGGEILDASLSDYDRIGGLAPVPMPGGDRATRVPGRMLAGILADHPAYDTDRIAAVLRDCAVPFPTTEERDIVCQQLRAGTNIQTTSSAGRVLDAVSALVGCCERRRYEGEPAQRLAALARDGTPLEITPQRTEAAGRPVIDTPALLDTLVTELQSGTSPAVIAATVERALAVGLGRLACDSADMRDRTAIGVAGGVAYNERIVRTLRQVVEANGYTFLTNSVVPRGDGGIAYGQAAVAAATTDDT